jgi:hypothetical protein
MGFNRLLLFLFLVNLATVNSVKSPSSTYKHSVIDKNTEKGKFEIVALFSTIRHGARHPDLNRFVKRDKQGSSKYTPGALNLKGKF